MYFCVLFNFMLKYNVIVYYIKLNCMSFYYVRIYYITLHCIILKCKCVAAKLIRFLSVKRLKTICR